VLSEEERRRRDLFAFAEDRRDFTAAHALLRTRLEGHATLPAAAWQFRRGTHGKPHVVEEQAGWPPLHVNLSHTRGLVACVIARGIDVGVDVERLGRIVEARALANRFFSVTEVAALNGAPSGDFDVRFLELWTLKEAYVKGEGRGLAQPFHSFGFSFDCADGLGFRAPADTPTPSWQFTLTAPSEVHRLSVAVLSGPTGSASKITIRDVDRRSPAATRRSVLRRTRDTVVEFASE